MSPYPMRTAPGPGVIQNFGNGSMGCSVKRCGANRPLFLVAGSGRIIKIRLSLVLKPHIQPGHFIIRTNEMNSRASVIPLSEGGVGPVVKQRLNNPDIALNRRFYQGRVSVIVNRALGNSRSQQASNHKGCLIFENIGNYIQCATELRQIQRQKQAPADESAGACCGEDISKSLKTPFPT